MTTARSTDSFDFPKKFDFVRNPSAGGGAPEYAGFKGVRKEICYIVKF